MKFPVLETKRLVLNELKEEHLDEFFPFAHSEGKPIKDKKTALAKIRSTNELYKKGETINWGLFLDGKLIGTAGYYRGFKNNTGEVGYVMHSDYHGNGYMSEAVRRIIDFGKSELNLKKIEAYTEFSNKPSVRLLEKIGFRNTGRILEPYTIFEFIPNLES